MRTQNKANLRLFSFKEREKQSERQRDRQRKERRSAVSTIAFPRISEFLVI